MIRRLMLLSLGLLLFAACSKTSTQSTFNPVADVAAKQLDLLLWVTGAAIVVMVLVQGALVYTIVRFRRKPGDDTLPVQTHGNTRLEIAWTIAPVILLAGLAIPTVSTLWELDKEPPSDALHVRAIAHQWWWEFQYTDHGFVTANELRVPVGRPVSIQLESEDVLHSFWVPKIAGKVDMVPGYVNRLPTFIIDPDSEGTYLGQCAELCGTSHALMRFRVIAHSDADFSDWISGQQMPATVSGRDGVEEGLAVFRGAGACTLCHLVDVTDLETEGSTPRVRKAPNLAHFASRTTLAAGLLDNTSENLEDWLRNPDKLKPDNLMFKEAPVYTNPALALDEQQIAALVTFLRSLD